MSPLQSALMKWAEELEQVKTPEWNSFPDIDLYMDQVITWLERQMTAVSPQDGEKQITPAMINNYVKNQVIPRPVQKKYTRDHLAYLIVVMNLKQVLPLSDIAWLIARIISDNSIRSLFDQFTAMQDESLRHAAERVKEPLGKLDDELSPEDAEKSLSILALKLSLEANAYSVAAKTILDQIKEQKEKAVENKDNKDKSKERKKEQLKPDTKGPSPT